MSNCKRPIKFEINAMNPNKEIIKEENDQKRRSRGKDWERRFNIEENRVADYVELYESIGFEVRVEDTTPNEKKDCQVCFKADFDNLKTIYIRLKDNEMKLI